MHALPSNLVLPLRTVSGEGSADTLLAECRTFGQRGAVVHGSSLKRSGALDRIMATADRDVMTWCYPGGEPTLNQLTELREALRAHRVDWVTAVGGGSVLDVAKAATGLLDAPHPPADYHAGAAIPPSRRPFVAAPTTAGTGSEATMVSVLTDEAQGVKKSIRHPSFMARLVVLDPLLLHGCPPEIVASAGMDALTQAVEAFISRQASAFTDALAQIAIPAIHHALPRLYRGETDAAAALLEGSYLAGIALSGARLGIVHGLAHPLGVRYHMPHGRVCAICLLPALRFNRDAMGAKHAVLKELLDGDPIEVVASLAETLNIAPAFRGRKVIDEAGIIEETLASGSTAANPREVTTEDVRWFLHELF